MTDLAAAISTARHAVDAADSSALDAQARVNRLELAQIITDEGIPVDATIAVLDWAEEPNRDGTFDVTLSEVLDGNGDHFDDLSVRGDGAIAAGRYDGDTPVTDWDVFTNGTALTEPLQVARVLDWLAEQGLATATPPPTV